MSRPSLSKGVQKLVNWDSDSEPDLSLEPNRDLQIIELQKYISSLKRKNSLLQEQQQQGHHQTSSASFQRSSRGSIRHSILSKTTSSSLRSSGPSSVGGIGGGRRRTVVHRQRSEQDHYEASAKKALDRVFQLEQELLDAKRENVILVAKNNEQSEQVLDIMAALDKKNHQLEQSEEKLKDVHNILGEQRSLLIEEKNRHRASEDRIQKMHQMKLKSSIQRNTDQVRTELQAKFNEKITNLEKSHARQLDELNDKMNKRRKRIDALAEALHERETLIGSQKMRINELKDRVKTTIHVEKLKENYSEIVKYLAVRKFVTFFRLRRDLRGMLLSLERIIQHIHDNIGDDTLPDKLSGQIRDIELVNLHDAKQTEIAEWLERTKSIERLMVQKKLKSWRVFHHLKRVEEILVTTVDEGIRRTKRWKKIALAFFDRVGGLCNQNTQLQKEIASLKKQTIAKDEKIEALQHTLSIAQAMNPCQCAKLRSCRCMNDCIGELDQEVKANVQEYTFKGRWASKLKRCVGNPLDQKFVQQLVSHFSMLERTVKKLHGRLLLARSRAKDLQSRHNVLAYRDVLFGGNGGASSSSSPKLSSSSSSVSYQRQVERGLATSQQTGSPLCTRQNTAPNGIFQKSEKQEVFELRAKIAELEALRDSSHGNDDNDNSNHNHGNNTDNAHNNNSNNSNNNGNQAEGAVNDDKGGLHPDRTGSSGPDNSSSSPLFDTDHHHTDTRSHKFAEDHHLHLDINQQQLSSSGIYGLFDNDNVQPSSLAAGSSQGNTGSLIYPEPPSSSSLSLSSKNPVPYGHDQHYVDRVYYHPGHGLEREEALHSPLHMYMPAEEPPLSARVRTRRRYKKSQSTRKVAKTSRTSTRRPRPLHSSEVAKKIYSEAFADQDDHFYNSYRTNRKFRVESGKKRGKHRHHHTNDFDQEHQRGLQQPSRGLPAISSPMTSASSNVPGSSSVLHQDQHQHQHPYPYRPEPSPPSAAHGQDIAYLSSFI